MHLTAFTIGVTLSLVISGLAGITSYLTDKYRKKHQYSGYPKEYHIQQAVQQMIADDKRKYSYLKNRREKPTKYFFDTRYPISFYDAEAFIEEYENAVQNELEKREENRQLKDMSKNVEHYRGTRQEVRKHVTELGEK